MFPIGRLAAKHGCEILGFERIAVGFSSAATSRPFWVALNGGRCDALLTSTWNGLVVGNRNVTRFMVTVVPDGNDSDGKLFATCCRNFIYIDTYCETDRISATIVRREMYSSFLSQTAFLI